MAKDTFGDQITKARLGLDTPLTEIEQEQITALNDVMLQLLVQLNVNYKVGAQSMSEVIYSALSKDVYNKEEFMKVIYNFVHNYFIPQAEAFAGIIVERRRELKDPAKLQEHYRKWKEHFNEAAPQVKVTTVDGIIDAIEDALGPCDCPKCVEKRRLEEIERNTPNPQTKH